MIRAWALIAAFVITSCVQAPGTSTNQQTTPASTASAFQATQPPATATPSPPVTASDLIAVAAKIYPKQQDRYVTCDFSAGGPSRYSQCLLTPRLNDRLLTVFTGISAPEPLGGGQDPEWPSESISADVSGAGGIAHVVLTKPASPSSRYDLVIIQSGSRLLVDDIYCTGADRATSSIYVDGWMNRYSC